MNKQPVPPSIGIPIAWEAYEKHCRQHGRKPNPLRFGATFAQMYGPIDWQPPEPQPEPDPDVPF